MPAVSVIIPVYKAHEYISKCAESLFSQTLKDIEYIFIDDCTPDDSIQIIKNVLEQYPHRRPQVKIIKMQCNSGTGAVRKRGLEVASGEYVIHCDSDDWIDPQYYEKLYEAAIRESADIVVSNFIREYRKSAIRIECFATKNPVEALYNMPNNSFYCMLWNKLIRRDLLITHNISTLDRMDMWEDVLVTIQAYYFANKVAKAEGVCYHYIVNPNSYTANSANKNSYMQRKMCIDALSQFFASKDGDWTLFMDYWKLLAKSYLLQPGSFNPRKWRNEYSEASKSITLISEFSKKQKRIMQLSRFSLLLPWLYNFPTLFSWRLKRLAKSIVR